MDERDSNARLRERRRRRRRQVRRRRAVAAAVLFALAAGITLGARSVGGGGTHAAATRGERPPAREHRPGPAHAPVPREIRGVHVTMSLASLPGKLRQYLALTGLNTIELDVKDESGRVGFVPSAVPLARRTGAAGPFYKAKRAARLVHARGDYLIGRVVTFEDPVLSEQRPELAIHRSDGSLWTTNAGLGWTNPYDRRVWRYNVDVAVAAARAGFDEIQFDYVRFPSDGDLSLIRYPGAHPQPMAWTIPAFVQYAAGRLHPLGVRVSVDVFGLSATRDLGIGQLPRRISRYVDAVYPMVYPSHYNPGEYDLTDPNAVPGETVTRSLLDFQIALEGRRARLTPWLQDFSLGRTYTLDDVRAQVAAARAQHTHGFLLWNAEGVYSAPALLPPA
ncbi:MAG TPA: putative glycoside hydrolase [Gaiellaceae bacterium]|nr:putative glycoside hydrolase [Gaiellaceae bacterium]